MTAKQKLFCNEYLIDLNATQAAIRAGYSESSAKEIGSINLTKVNIKEYIEKRMGKREIRTEITQDKVLNELAKIGFANIDDYVEVELDEYEDKVVKIKATKDIPDDKIAAISSIKQGANGIEVKLHDKVKALENIGRHLGMFKDKLEISGTNEIQVKLED
ncbi:terminase small subunit [Clostridium botulinum]|uniref:Terminase small subunit n=2 Tax=Clostridium botulinum TaxID=1491 RepID=A0A6B4JHF7_CLOBO|nr:terminase small subunit [Clostridium botulinum]MBY6759718.1 terminase small subunit [Clostridium botulinum]MBY6918627.1 terminase small subunit [Clostridium botulinum]MCR1129712.1 terminase small subunit [Clostridium botulinum]NFJ56436.1 terminase small subunit [Clostridium botulinum]NFL51104.1 terminase small subunit [Clostridium botulinum]